jgi:hypothetical protein
MSIVAEMALPATTRQYAHECVNCRIKEQLTELEINESVCLVLCGKCQLLVRRLQRHDSTALACGKCRKQRETMILSRSLGAPTARCVNCLLDRHVENAFDPPAAASIGVPMELPKAKLSEVVAPVQAATPAGRATKERRQTELREAQRILDRSFAHIYGMDDVKQQLTVLFKRLVADEIDRSRGRTIVQRMPHFVLKGNPGTGKNTVARAIQAMLVATKVVKGGTFYEIKAASLTAGFVGQTKDHVASEVAKAADGVLFIDEAHELANTSGPKACPRDQFSGEAFNGLMHAMGDEGTKAKCAMIFAGYPEEMDKFARDLNPGFQRRITGGVFELPDFDADGLTAVLKSQMSAQGRRLDDEAQWDNIKVAFERVEPAVLKKHNAGLVGQVMQAVRDHLLSQVSLEELAELDDELDLYAAADVINAIADLSRSAPKSS